MNIYICIYKYIHVCTRANETLHISIYLPMKRSTCRGDPMRAAPLRFAPPTDPAFARVCGERPARQGLRLLLIRAFAAWPLLSSKERLAPAPLAPDTGLVQVHWLAQPVPLLCWSGPERLQRHQRPECPVQGPWELARPSEHSQRSLSAYRFLVGDEYR